MKGQSIIPPGPVAVIGAGTMGSGIAQALAQAGFSVRVRDVDTRVLDRGRAQVERMLAGAVERKKMTAARKEEVLSRLQFTTDLKEAATGAVLVVEAIFEDLEVKNALFRELAGLVGETTLVATNTSSLSVGRLAEGFPDPGRFAGLHFFFPAPINKLLEVVGGPATRPEMLDELDRLGYRLRKIPIRTADRAGFCVNRFFVPYLNEACRLVEEGVASMATVEEVGRELFRATLGPFELMNVTGIPIAFHAQTSLAQAFGPAYAPSRLLEEKFRSGGPWPWKATTVDPDKKARVRDRFIGLTVGIAARLVEEGVATAEATDRGALVGLRRGIGPFALASEVGLADALRLVEAYAAPWGDRFPVATELRNRVARGETRWELQRVRTERYGSVVWVLLDRPEVLNSLNSDLLAQVEATFRTLARDPGVRCVVLAGSGPVFAAGADIAEMEAKSHQDGIEFGFRGQATARSIEEFPAPVIALVEGYALGGGLELALAADFIVAADDARLGLPEVTVGIHPGMGGASRLTRLIGRGRTKLLTYTGVPIPAAEAERMGFVARVVPSASAREETQKLADLIAQRAPLGVRWIKQVIDHGMDSPLATALYLEGTSAGQTFATADRHEGMRAFLDRRPPKFEGQ